jgi:hypothetical protein
MKWDVRTDFTNGQPAKLLDAGGAEIKYARWFDTQTGVAVTLRRNTADTSFVVCDDDEMSVVEDTKTYPAPLRVVPIQQEPTA